MMKPTKLFLDGNIRNESSINLHEDDEFSPIRSSENVGFIMPEDQLEMKVYHRPNGQNAKTFEYRPIPGYLSLCYEEFSRHYSAVTGGRSDLKGNVELDPKCEELESEDAEVSPNSILKYYNPGFDRWNSTFKFAPKNTRHIFHGYIHSDFNYVIRFVQFTSKNQKMFEPLFGSACLYTFIKDELHCVSESFYFDATSEEHRYHYRQIYHPLVVDESKRVSFRGSSKIVGDSSGGSSPHFNMFCVTIPEQLRGQDVFLVISVNKVLSNDSDKAVLPYFPRFPAPDLQEHRESCERLSKFKQPIGISVLKLNDAKRNEGLIVYAQKYCFGEAQLAQFVRSVFPLDGNATTRNDQLDLEIKLNIFEAGPTDSLRDRLTELGLTRNISPSGTNNNNSSPSKYDPKQDAVKTEALFLPAQIHSSQAPLVPVDEPSLPELFGIKSPVLVIRKVMPLIPTAFPWAKSVVRQMRTNVDNTLYLYVTQFDKFHNSHRNLSVKVELVELQRKLDTNKEKCPTSKTELKVLPNIYHTGPLIGDDFVSEAYSRVSYHIKNPSTLDEFKIRLPDVVTDRHWLKFTVLHVHVKPQAKRGNLLQAIIRAPVEKENIDATEIGIGFLQILTNGNSLLDNLEHTVFIRSTITDPSGEVPFIKVKTNAICSLLSSSIEVQRLLNECPANLGYMPSSIVPMDVAAKLSAAAATKHHKEMALVAILQDLIKANPLELSRHFLIIMRIILRVLVGGSGIFQESYVNPFRHNDARCQAFLTLLQIIEKVFGGAVNASGTSENHNEKEVFEAYIDYLFDEEMPLPGEYLVTLEDVYDSHADVIDESGPPSLRFKDSHRSVGKASSSPESNQISEESQSKHSQLGNESSTAENVIVEDNRKSLTVVETTEIQVELSEHMVLDTQYVSDEEDESSSSEEQPFPPTKSSSISHHQSLVKPLPLSRETSNAPDTPTDENQIMIDDMLISPLADVDINEQDLDDSELISNMTCSPEKLELAHNAKRLSWGNFITDSQWASGMLISIPELLSNESGSPIANVDPAAIASSKKYLDEIVTHCVLQSERIIEERLVNIAINELLTSFLSSDDENEAYMWAGKRYRYSGPFDKNKPELPFAIEKSWFDAIDKGFVTDENDLIINEEFTRKKLTMKLIGTRVRHRENMPIQPSNALHDNLDGYKERFPLPADSAVVTGSTSCQGTSIDGDGANNIGFASGRHWWPWIYEVVTFQWGTLLTMFLSAGNLVSPNNVHTITATYPFGVAIGAEADRTASGNEAKQTRVLLMEHGPLLLRMIFKSLCLRILRETKRPPVLLDSQYLASLENLVMLLTTESFTGRGGTWRSRRMISSLSNFLRGLFCAIAPLQVIRLIRSALKCVKNRNTADEEELRLTMIQEFTLFEYWVACNFPYTLDAPISSFSLVIDTLTEARMSDAMYTSCGIRYSTSPMPNTLAHLIISEITLSSKQSSRREPAWAILRDLLVRHSYDARFQNKESQQRIVCMYLPLLKEIVEDADRIAGLRYDSNERREILAILLYLLSGVPDQVLRHQIRCMTMLVGIGDMDTSSPLNGNSSNSGSTGGLNINNGGNGSSGAPTPTSINYSGGGGGRSTRVISLKKEKTQARDVDIDSYISKSEIRKNQVHNMCLMLHLMIDTFELPQEGGDNKDETTRNLLSPSVLLEHLAMEIPAVESSSSTNGPNNSNNGSSSGITRKTSVPDMISPQPVKYGGPTKKLDDLDSRMNRRHSINTRKSVASAPSVAPDERKLLNRAKKSTRDYTIKDRPTAMRPVLPDQVRVFGERLSVSAVKVLLRVLWMMFEECPPVYDHKRVDKNTTFILRDLNIDECLLTGIANLRIILFMRMALSVILHALYCNQNDASLVDLYICADAVVRQFGARVFLAAVEDALQYWLRICLFHFASTSSTVRESACNFFLCLARASYHYLGSFTLISTTVLAVVDDVIAEILDCNRKNISTFSDEDKVLQKLHDSIRDMRSVAKAKLDKQRATALGERSSPFGASLMSFLNDLTVILFANAELRRHVSHPVGYDFKGANLLDGPFDERASNLIQAARKKRKDVKNDNDAVTAKSGFHIEEVMMHFVKAAEIYDTYKLPRFRMHWLENLARLHELRSNRAEAAEIRWRIFLLCEQVENVWQQLWVPRPPLAWRHRGSNTQDLLAEIAMFSKVGDEVYAHGDRNFYNVFVKAMDMKPTRPWFDVQQYWTHMETALTVVTERYCSVNLIQLAERSSTSLLELYRLNKRSDMMMIEYSRMAAAIKATTEKGITSSIAMGTFYRVSYAGLGAPEYLRDKEFIFRNANHLHVSEFHTLVMNHVKSIVRDGVDVKLIHDVNGNQDFRDENIAYIIMNSVKLVMTQYGKSNQYRLVVGGQYGSKRPTSFPRSTLANFRVEDMNQASVFQYSQPFTQDGSRAHAKKMDEQWMKTTILTVKEPFPYILTRQLVASREVLVLSPIEVAIQDIEDRIESMEQEIDTVMSKPSDSNNLMRIIQGTVMPQVNAGATEVAKLFLSQGKAFSLSVKVDEMKFAEDAETPEGKLRLFYAQEEARKFPELTIKLKVTLLNFLQLSKLLLLKTRKLFVPDLSLLEPTSILNDLPQFGANLPHLNDSVTFRSSVSTVSTDRTSTVTQSATVPPVVYTAQELINIKWQIEMERGFKTLVDGIFPFICDLREADLFIVNRSQYTSIGGNSTPY